MGQVFDEEDYRRRLEALETSDITVGQEAGLISEGVATYGSGSGAARALNARKDILLAKQEALRQARKEMIRAIIRAEQDQAFNGVLPAEVEQIVTGKSDEIVKV
ncbi:hypothetical protein PMI42_00709 [Bradyrhizobium sp. YR681]|uniref:hypothetical protein n=1 Tax=Bradyrhizobium sp. YR681 TaxID=1144344 RepID=UPI000270E682|nr:hypothetical protein [Bradyrhizobium sp. YR681]EJN15692.1 hypothetical protein PMI42_00709 [Bradyrhizobium sp. YR681]